MRRIVCEFEEETVEAYAGWTECVAFRFVRVDDDHVRLELAKDLELITRPEVEQRAA